MKDLLVKFKIKQIDKLKTQFLYLKNLVIIFEKNVIIKIDKKYKISTKINQNSNYINLNIILKIYNKTITNMIKLTKNLYKTY